MGGGGVKGAEPQRGRSPGRRSSAAEGCVEKLRLVPGGVQPRFVGQFVEEKTQKDDEGRA